jgi:serine/threonine-protein phosphatase PGAM5
MPKRVLYMIRNGEYHRDSMDEAFNAPLTERGIEQAQRTGRSLKDLPIQTIYTSPHEQTGATANWIREALPNTDFYASDKLKQYRSSSVGKTFTRELILKAIEDTSNESQMESAFQQFFQPATEHDIHEILVCHGNIIVDLICHATNVNSHTWSHMLINNCSINIVSIESADEMKLVAYNDVRHLPDNLRTD